MDEQQGTRQERLEPEVSGANEAAVGAAAWSRRRRVKILQCEEVGSADGTVG